MGGRRWRRVNARLDPDTDFVEIYRVLAQHEFPWDVNQSLGFALFRTYAVPTIGGLLDRTGEFEQRCQKRYDDTTMLLEAPLTHGLDSAPGRVAIRRINDMHRRYEISNDDMRYVLATFVVIPVRWIGRFGWRRLTEGEVRASVNYYRALGRRLGVRDLPSTYAGFAALLDEYESRHFAFDQGGRRVADATMRLLASYYPPALAALLDVFGRTMMEPHLLAAFGYPEPGRLARRIAESALRTRAVLLRGAPARRRPKVLTGSSRIRSYPAAVRLERLGTFVAQGTNDPRSG